MSSELGFPPGVRWISACPGCHFEKLGCEGGLRWRCDGFHPEVLAQIGQWQAEQERARNEKEAAFWRWRD